MSKYSIEDVTLTDIANAIRARHDIVRDITPVEMPLMIDLITGDSAQEFSLEVLTANIYTASNKMLVGQIANFDPSAKYLITGWFDGDISGATSSNPILTHYISLCSAQAFAGSYAELYNSFRFAGGSTYSSNAGQSAVSASTISPTGAFSFWSKSGNTYTRLGAGTYKFKIFKM